MRYIKNLLIAALALTGLAGTVNANDANQFRFESVHDLDGMRNFVRNQFRSGSARSDLRRILVDQGNATLVVHPTSSNVEKYIYDINLCDLYIWRWNISADFTDADVIAQIYVNGEAVFENATSDPLEPDMRKDKTGTGVYKMARPRPEAFRGESTLMYVLIDQDVDLATKSDQMLIGGGPTRADPRDFGELHGYESVPWRSIFDDDKAQTIVPFKGQCPAIP